MKVTKQTLYIESLTTITQQAELLLEGIRNIVPSKLKHVGLIGCGGTLAQLYPLHYVMERYGASFVTTIHNGGELMTRKPNYVSSHSLFFASSHSGETKETVNAVQYAKEQGAKIISVTANSDSSLGKLSDLCLTYNDGPALSEAKLMIGHLVGLEVLTNAGHLPKFADILKTWKTLPESFVAVMEQLDANAASWARRVKNEKLFYVLGTGPAYGPAYAFTICKLMEMQWLNGVPLNAAELFNGPVEAVYDELPVLVLASEDKVRPQAERAIKFLEQYTSKLHVIDTKTIELTCMPEEHREIFSALLLWPAINIYAEKLSDATGHPLSKRRYMGIVDY